MPNYSDLILPKLSTSHPFIEGHADLVMPSYDGYGLANLPSSLCKWFGAEPLGIPLGAEVHGQLPTTFKRIVVLLVDALGYTQLVNAMDGGKAAYWRSSLDRAAFFPLTSVCPSTTATALTTLWTATTPNTHGIIGYEMWSKSLSMVINNILHSPASYEGDIGSLVKAGFDPISYLDQEALAQKLAYAGIETHVCLPRNIITSGLSQMHGVRANMHGYIAESDLFATLRDLVNAPTEAKSLIYGYWSTNDTLMHRFGPADERVVQDFHAFSRAMEEVFFEGVDERARKETLFLIIADHGAVATPIRDEVNLANHPQFTEMLRMAPTCENRLPFLYLKAGQEEAARQYIAAAWPGEFAVLTREQALGMQLFGRGVDHPHLQDRIGDLVLVPLEPSSYLWWATKMNIMRGRHGGLHRDEMLIPLYALPLG